MFLVILGYYEVLNTKSGFGERILRKIYVLRQMLKSRLFFRKYSLLRRLFSYKKCLPLHPLRKHRFFEGKQVGY